ncbi:MAG: hypothetical protein R6X20_00365 [Phycisphaerae bacterium]
MTTSGDPAPTPAGRYDESFLRFCETATDSDVASRLREVAANLKTWDRQPSAFLEKHLAETHALACWLDPRIRATTYTDADGLTHTITKTALSAPNRRSHNLRAAASAIAEIQGCVNRGQRPPGETITRLLATADALDGGQGRKDAASSAPLPERIIQLCDEMMNLGREPGSGAPFVVSAKPPGKQERGSRENRPEAEQAPAVGEHKATSGPSGFLGKMGMACDEAWGALASEFDRRATDLADLVKALDPSYGVGKFYSPQPVTVWEAYPKARKAFTEPDRKWHRDNLLSRGKTEAEADALLDSLDATREAQTCAMWTKMQWPGFVREVGGHRVFLSGPALVHAFDRRFKALRLRAQRLQGEPAERTESQGARSGAVSARPGATAEADQLRKIADAFRTFQRLEEETHDNAKTKPESPERAELSRKADAAAADAFDLAAENLPLLRRCQESYGCSAQARKNVDLIMEYRSLPTAERMPFIAQWCREFVSMHPTTGEINSPVDELERWAGELDRAAAAQEAPQEEPAKRPEPEGSWSKPMTKAKMMDILGLDSYKTFNAYADRQGIRQAGNRRTWQLPLGGLDEETREKFRKA